MYRNTSHRHDNISDAIADRREYKWGLNKRPDKAHELAHDRRRQKQIEISWLFLVFVIIIPQRQARLERLVIYVSHRKAGRVGS